LISRQYFWARYIHSSNQLVPSSWSPLLVLMLIVVTPIYKGVPFHQWSVQYWFFSWLERSSVGFHMFSHPKHTSTLQATALHLLRSFYLEVFSNIHALIKASQKGQGNERKHAYSVFTFQCLHQILHFYDLRPFVIKVWSNIFLFSNWNKIYVIHCITDERGLFVLVSSVFKQKIVLKSLMTHLRKSFLMAQ